MKHNEIVEIPIAEIHIANPRHRDKLVFDKIVNNIDQVGLKRPITVSEREDQSDGARCFSECAVSSMSGMEDHVARNL